MDSNERPREGAHAAGEAIASVAASPLCPRCDAVAWRLNRRMRRRMRTTDQWRIAHTDTCPLAGGKYTPGWHAAGVVRSPWAGA